MSTTTRLGLKSPGPTDDWGTVLNENFTKIDEEFQALSEELTGSKTGAVAGTLKGTEASLQARLNADLEDDGTIEEMRKAKLSRLADTTTISDRLALTESHLLEVINDTAFIGAPDEVLRSRDARSSARLETSFYNGGGIDRWKSNTSGQLFFHTDLTAYMNLYQAMYTKPTIYCLISNRWYCMDYYYTNDSIYVARNLVTGTYAICASTWDTSGEPNAISTIEFDIIDTVTNGTIGTSTSANVITETVPAYPSTRTHLVVKTGDQIEVSGETGYFRVKTITLVGTLLTITVHGEFSNPGATGVTATIRRKSRPAYLTAFEYTDQQELFDIHNLPGCVMLSKATIDTTAHTYTYEDCKSLNNLSRYVFAPGGTFGAAYLHQITFEHNSLAKNIVPIVVDTSGEVIYPGEWSVSTSGTNIVNIRKTATTTIMCKRPSDGTFLDEGDVSHWGVLIEL